MKSLVLKHSIIIGGHKTSVSLENQFWTGLKDIAERRHMTLSSMVSNIDAQRRQGNLSSAIRLFVLENARAQAVDFVGNGPTLNARNGEGATRRA
jgi:predicted DNA-binding ribbon-helix-helix protein